MKKSLKIILPLLMLGLIFSAQNIRAAYTLSPGIYNYDINESGLVITSGVNTVDVVGFYVSGDSYPDHTPITLNVTTVGASSVEYNLTATGIPENHTTIPSDVSYLYDLMVHPFTLLGGVALNTWNQSEMEALHLGILMLPFIYVEATTWSDWIDVVDGISENNTLLGETFNEGLEVRTKYTNATDDFFVELYYRGDFAETITGTDVMSIVDVKIEHKLLFGYTKATGVMLGMKMEGSIEGLANGTTLDCTYIYNTEKLDYNLPDYDLDKATWPLPGLEIGIGLGVISSIALATIIIRRKK
ncbi:MAG: hypothetical protein FK733_15415 [Asgard group archaeon]|nr:hypothetical protein [Asgard group archaeon]